MNTYQMSIPHFAGGLDYFTVEANSKEEAVAKGIAYAKSSPNYWGGNWYCDKVKCVKKIQKKK